MPFEGSMMWRFSTLFNYIRGGVRSGAWRVRETPSQLISDDRDDRDDKEQEAPPVRSAGRPLRTVTGGRPAVRRPCGGTAVRRSDGPPAVGGPGPAAVRLPPTAALWYLGLADQPAAATSSACTAAAATVTAGTVTVGTPTSTSLHSPPATATVHVDPTAPIPSACAPPATAHVVPTAPIPPAGSLPATATAHVVPTAPIPPAGPADPVPAPATASPTAADDSEPLDSLSALRVSFAAEHDRLMASLQNAAGAGAATSRPRQALECFRTAAGLGSPAAWFNCGLCFQEGRGTDVDLEKASVCYEEAVRLGHPAAGYNLALLAAAGRLMTSSHDVTELLERAAAAGSREAAEFLKTWCIWSEEQDQEPEGEECCCLSLGPPGRSVSLPALRVCCGPESDPDLEPCCALQEQRQPALFYLHESP